MWFILGLEKDFYLFPYTYRQIKRLLSPYGRFPRPRPTPFGCSYMLYLQKDFFYKPCNSIVISRLLENSPPFIVKVSTESHPSFRILKTYQMRLFEPKPFRAIQVL